ncbi:hypothetical protein EV182_000690 [Spiromyces aspiralis]|uniref:Uncharacterized protein n=1 Tax=Spiromyces aspiralis TaxID=68401 RepID=A0ACC1HXP7_9FUNG|nr:hypothetical protein EV182_000690 [Spiromyces aspiralis]
MTDEKSKLPFDLSADDAPDGEKSLYEILGIKESATDDEIKRAYRTLALRTHPDKVAATVKDKAERERTTKLFQQVGFAYAVLSDKKKRARYDRTGRIEDLDVDDLFEEGKDWDAYFRELWSGVVDATTIENFSKKYKGSEEEKNDILREYKAGDGDMDHIMANVMLAGPDDELRIVAIIDNGIKSGEIERTKVYVRTKRQGARRRKEAEREAAEAEELRKELGLDAKLRKIKSKRKHDNNSNEGDGNGDSDDDDEEEEEEGNSSDAAPSTPKRKKKRPCGGKPAEDNEDEDALKSLIRHRSIKRMDNIVAKLEAKYGSPKKSKRGKANPPPEPTEEEFLAIQARLFKKTA